ncbi:MAG: hypothetical protein ACLTG4_03995 [Oscillospiraceae bacterium]
MLEHCGHIDAESIEEYLSIGGYGARPRPCSRCSRTRSSRP